ncbi:SDR family oxidoreductase [Spongiibacter sp. KMU-158]|uniref:SDR family oxidoreductase n=1 Tax=Spongiibacter pelagi TaxID=2760804 RepID=A0A927C0N2_9GAMM|nr:SDR family oxidoreductase [Spongiibacter pelagi]MBD2858008.1 SDR family oxidoreductase [Spongiibacter pelagi]
MANTSGKLLVITGASQGIGFYTAQRFLEQGYRVLNLSRRPCALDGVQNIPVDLQDPSGLSSCQQELVTLCTGAEKIVVIHNAASQQSDTVESLSAADFQRVLQVNLIAPQQLNQLLIPLMGAGSAIIYVGSTLAEKAVAGFASYVASKHGLIGLMRATVQDLVGRGIHSACVCPGFTGTDMLHSQIAGNAEVMAAITGMVSFGRLIEPGEIAETLWFCAQNPVINGAVIHANLGQIER